MSNPKIEKVKADIEKTKSKIAALQSKLREQEREKIRLENEDIIALVRSERLSDAELNALMLSFRKEEPAGKELSAQKIFKEEADSADLDEN